MSIGVRLASNTTSSGSRSSWKRRPSTSGGTITRIAGSSSVRSWPISPAGLAINELWHIDLAWRVDGPAVANDYWWQVSAPDLIRHLAGRARDQPRGPGCQQLPVAVAYSVSNQARVSCATRGAPQPSLTALQSDCNRRCHSACEIEKGACHAAVPDH